MSGKYLSIVIVSLCSHNNISQLFILGKVKCLAADFTGGLFAAFCQTGFSSHKMQQFSRNFEYTFVFFRY